MIFILFFKSSIRGITLLPFILIALFLMGAETLSGGIRPISDLHENNSLGVPVLLDSIVQVQGIVTVSNQLGNISYIQDTTGGVAVFDIDFVDSVQIGDILIVTGKLSQFNNSISKNDGLTRLINVTINSIIETGVEPEYKVVKASDIGTEGDGGIELIEGELIRVNGVSLSGGSNTWPPNGSSSATDGTGSLTIFSDIDSDVAFSSKPRGSFDIIGVLDQFDVDSPYTSGYRIIPRFTADIIEKISPVFSSALRVVEVGSTWVELAWSTEDSSFGSVRFTKEGSNSADEQKTGLTDGSHKFVVDGLASSTFYYARVSAWFRSDTTLSTEVFFLTSSPPESSVEIRVF
ncbi:MAG: hypothetical protein IIC40_08630, partial [Candidatus Marinimicrobia bacterium]|nr:hypothetical protein [Candidatus Neomarinimicrobiota bacterium]